MLRKIKEIIQSMDTKKDREASHSKAQAIYQLGPKALNVLVNIGRDVNLNEGDVATRKRLIRAVIFSLSKFAKKRFFLKPRLLKNNDAVDLLCDFAEQGFNSAHMLLSALGFSSEDIIKRRLLSLPVVDARENDHEITLNEAVEEIKTADLASYVKKIKNRGYLIGTANKHSHEIFKTGKNTFTYRIHRL